MTVRLSVSCCLSARCSLSEEGASRAGSPEDGFPVAWGALKPRSLGARGVCQGKSR